MRFLNLEYQKNCKSFSKFFVIIIIKAGAPKVIASRTKIAAYFLSSGYLWL